MNLTDEQFTTLILQLLREEPNADSNKRAAPRLPLPSRTFITPLGTDDQPLEPVKVSVLDLSFGGICFLNRSKLESGMKFLMHLNHEDGQSVPMLCQVVHCRNESESVYRIGSRFINLLAPQEKSEK